MDGKNANGLVKFLLSNINVKSRPNNLMEIGEALSQLIENLEGSKKAVAKSLQISVDMINKFLSVFKVSSEVQILVKERKIDSIFAVHALKSLTGKDQLIVAKEIVNNDFSSQEARALIPLKNTFPKEPIERLMEVIRQTKDNQHYVNHFPYPDDIKKVEMITHSIKQIVGDEKFSLSSDGYIGVFKISKTGIKKMRLAASQQSMGFHNFLLKIFNTRQMK